MATLHTDAAFHTLPGVGALTNRDVQAPPKRLTIREAVEFPRYKAAGITRHFLYKNLGSKKILGASVKERRDGTFEIVEGREFKGKSEDRGFGLFGKDDLITLDVADMDEIASVMETAKGNELFQPISPTLELLNTGKWNLQVWSERWCPRLGRRFIRKPVIDPTTPRGWRMLYSVADRETVSGGPQPYPELLRELGKLQLTKMQRFVVTQRLHGATLEDIGKMGGIGHGGVQSRECRARREMSRELLARYVEAVKRAGGKSTSPRTTEQPYAWLQPRHAGNKSKAIDGRECEPTKVAIELVYGPPPDGAVRTEKDVQKLRHHLDMLYRRTGKPTKHKEPHIGDFWGREECIDLGSRLAQSAVTTEACIEEGTPATITKQERSPASSVAPAVVLDELHRCAFIRGKRMPLKKRGVKLIKALLEAPGHCLTITLLRDATKDMHAHKMFKELLKNPDFASVLVAPPPGTWGKGYLLKV